MKKEPIGMNKNKEGYMECFEDRVEEVIDVII